jgi:hypothetical protein
VRAEKELGAKKGLRLERVPLSRVPRKRRGKHFELMQQVLQELSVLSGKTAIKVPLGGNSAKDLRSAVVRAAVSKHIQIASTSDTENLYVWKKGI